VTGPYRTAPEAPAEEKPRRNWWPVIAIGGAVLFASLVVGLEWLGGVAGAHHFACEHACEQVDAARLESGAFGDCVCMRDGGELVRFDREWRRR
jgi:hypothetical protein